MMMIGGGNKSGMTMGIGGTGMGAMIDSKEPNKRNSRKA